MDKINFKKGLGIGILAVAFWVLICPPVWGQEFRVGTLFDHTGALKDWGPDFKKATELAIGQMAEAGFEMAVFHEDSGTDAQTAVAAANRLIEDQAVAAVLGSGSSGVIVPVAETVTCPKGVLMISPGATSPFISVLPADRNADLLFRTCPSDALQGVVLGKLAASRYQTASIMYVNNPYGQGLTDQFRRSFQKRGGMVYSMIPHGETVAPTYIGDLRKAFARVHLTKPFRSGKSDVLCVFSYPEHAKIYVKEAIQQFDCKDFLFCDGSKSAALAEAVGPENLEGLMGTAPGVAGGEASFNFNSDFKAAYGHLPTIPFTANAYDAAALLGLAAFAVQVKGIPLTSGNLRDQLRAVSNPPGMFVGPGTFEKAFDLIRRGEPVNYEGASGSVDFDENGDVFAPIEIWKYSDGRPVTYQMEYQITEE